MSSYDAVIAKFDNNLNLVDLKNYGTDGTDFFNTIILNGSEMVVGAMTTGTLENY